MRVAAWWSGFVGSIMGLAATVTWLILGPVAKVEYVLLVAVFLSAQSAAMRLNLE